MPKSNFEWGMPSYSQDIVDNFDRTHHVEEIVEKASFFDYVFKGQDDVVSEMIVKNDSEYLDSIQDEMTVSNAIVELADLHTFNDDYYYSDDDSDFDEFFYDDEDIF